MFTWICATSAFQTASVRPAGRMMGLTPAQSIATAG
jgi:hypothetical protein